MRNIIAAILTFALMLLCLAACVPSDKNGDDAEGVRSTIDDIPQTSTIPPYSEEYVFVNERSASCYIFDYNEALDMYSKLKERGIDFYNDYALFDYQNDEIFTVYMFGGVMTEESYLSREGKEFYELEFSKNTVNVSVNLLHRDKFKERTSMCARRYAFAVMGQSRSADIPKEITENFSFSNLSLLRENDISSGDNQTSDSHQYNLVYEDKFIAVIYSVNSLPDDFMEKIKDTFIILRREDS